MSARKVIVTGVTGQDGSYMVDYLLSKNNIEVYGLVRKTSWPNTERIKHIKNDRFKLVQADLTDSHSLDNAIRDIDPDYFINFAAQSFVGASWDLPKVTFETNATSVLDILEAIRTHSPQCRFYNAGTSEEFGDVVYTPQDESHPIRPRSPYGASKAAARHLVKVYRESYNLYAVQGWLFNHESPRRGEEFVTRKITKAISEMKVLIENDSRPEVLKLGNIDSKRDWSHARDFVYSVWLMLNQEVPKDYVIASGETRSVRDFLITCFDYAGFPIEFKGEGLNEKIIYKPYGVTIAQIDPLFYRPAEVSLLCGDASLAQSELGWHPEYTFSDLVGDMMEEDMKKIKIR